MNTDHMKDYFFTKYKNFMNTIKQSVTDKYQILAKAMIDNMRLVIKTIRTYEVKPEKYSELK